VIVPEPPGLADGVRWSESPLYDTAFTALQSGLGGSAGLWLKAGADTLVVRGVEPADGADRPALGIGRFMRLLSREMARFVSGGAGHESTAGQIESTVRAASLAHPNGLEADAEHEGDPESPSASPALLKAAEVGGEAGAPLRALPSMLGHETFLVVPSVFNLSVTLDALHVTGLDSFRSFVPFAPMADEGDAHSLAFGFGLGKVGVEADITVRSYPSLASSGSKPGPVFEHPTGAPLTMSTRASVAAAELDISGAVLLGINATALRRMPLWQLTRPACAARAVLASGLRRLQFGFDASATSIKLTPRGTAQPDSLQSGFTRLINDATAVALASFPAIIEEVVSGLARAPLVSAVNQLAAQQLTVPDDGLPADDSCIAPPIAPRRADWRETPARPDIFDLASRALRLVDGPRASQALRMLGLTGLSIPGRVFTGDSDSIFMSQMGLGVVQLEVRDLVVTGLDRLSSLSLLRPSPDSPLALDTALGLGDGAGTLTAAMQVRMAALGRAHSYDVHVGFQQVELRLRALVDVWRNLVGYIELGELTSACGALPLARLAWDAAHCGISFAGDGGMLALSMRGSQAAAAAGVSGEAALSFLRQMGSAVGIIGNDVADGFLAAAHNTCAQADAQGHGKSSERAGMPSHPWAPGASSRTELSAAAAAMRASGELTDLDQRTGPAAAALETIQQALARLSLNTEEKLRAAPDAEVDGAGGASSREDVGAVFYAGWEKADPIFIGVCALVWLAAAAASWMRWRRGGGSSLWAGALSGYLPRAASTALTVAMLVNMFLLWRVRTKPWPQMLAVVSVAGEELPGFSAFDFPSIGQFASKFWADGQYAFALALWLSCGLWPYLKLALAMLCLHAPHSILPRRRRRMLLEGTNFGAKWTRVHVDLVALLLLMCTLHISVGGGGGGAVGGEDGPPGSVTPEVVRLLSELGSAVAPTEAATAPPMMSMVTDIDPVWPVRQLLLLLLAIVLSQLVMVVHHCENEQHRLDTCGEGSCRNNGLAPAAEFRTSAAKAGCPAGPPTAPDDRDTALHESRRDTALHAARREAAHPASDDCGGASPSAAPWPRPVAPALSAAAPPRHALRSLPFRGLAPAGKGGVVNDRLPALAQWSISVGLVLSVCLLVSSWFVPLLAIHMTGLPRLALDADARDNQLSLASILQQLGHTVPHDILTRTLIQASYAVAVLIAPVAFQVAALYLWTRPLVPRARRAAALALRLLFAWCGIDVFLCLLVCMFLLPLKQQLSAEISASKGCGPIEPLMRVYFGAALGMHTVDDHCIGFSHTFHPGMALVAGALAVQYALAFFVMGASELAVDEEELGRGVALGRIGFHLRSVADAAPREARQPSALASWMPHRRPPPSPAAWPRVEELGAGPRDGVRDDGEVV